MDGYETAFEGARELKVPTPRPLVRVEPEELARFIDVLNSDDKSVLTADQLRKLDDLHLSNRALVWLGAETIIGTVHAIQWVIALLSTPRGDAVRREEARLERRDRSARWREQVDLVFSAPPPSARYLPSNLKGIPDGWIPSYLRVAEEGIPLYGIPSAEISTAFLAAEGKVERRALLQLRGEEIISDCRQALDGLPDSRHRCAVLMAIKALEAFEGGHIEAAQALTATVLTALKDEVQALGRQFTDQRVLPPRYAAEPAGLKELPLRMHLGFAPLWLAYAHFFAAQGDSIPTEFSRHATAHTVHPSQFTLANAVQGLMVVTSLLYLLGELEAEIPVQG